jgi:hypothetical protein
MTILAIDPGPVKSAWVVWDGNSLGNFGLNENDTVLALVDGAGTSLDIQRGYTYSYLVIEKVVSYGRPVGAETFETVYWTGRFAEAFGADHVERVERLEVKKHICHHGSAKDPHIRQALIDRFGGKAKAIGLKNTPGPLYGVKKDIWQALALAVTWYDQHAEQS